MRFTPILLARKVIAVTLGTKAGDIRKILNYDSRDWTVFKTVTANVAEALYGDADLANTPTVSKLSSAEKHKIALRVNRKLKASGVENMPTSNVLYWRLHRTLKNMHRMKRLKLARETYAEEHAIAGCAEELGPHVSRFMKLVRAEMVTYNSEHPDMTFTEIPNHVKNGIRDRVNRQLQLEGIPPVGNDLMRARIMLALMHIKVNKNRAKEQREAEGIPENLEKKLKPEKRRQKEAPKHKNVQEEESLHLD
ncbi:hypothetical protein K458DRAFT_100754 [Lentithecium fluviatile CBS 122367]|uniref:Uncharacterized protein n=1 Tax=Lentithecium fluviatile CBS 122367 TaxID=1168545 RepID=A0A6G1JJC4_9PLEO|nr:hypothetical protein K458DRAFT_100754 [Lentithecium fluviatile CBS 122367]